MKTPRPIFPRRVAFAFAALCFGVPNAFGQNAPNAANSPADLTATTVSTATAPGPTAALGRLSIAELQEIALQNNPALAVADRKTDAERGVYVQAGLRPNPSVRYQAAEVGAEGSAGKQGVVLEQELGDSKRRRLLQQTSQRSIEKLGQEREIAILKIKNDVRAASYRLLVAQKKVEFRQQIASVSQAAEDQARTLLGVGQTSELNIIQLQNQTRQAKLALSQEKNAKQALEKRLLVLIGLPTATLEGVADDVEALGGGEPLDENATLDDVLERSPEIARRRAEIREKQSALAFEQAPPRPFSVEGGVFYNFGDGTTLAEAGIGVPLRINDRNQGNVQRATAEYFAAQRELERTQLKLRADFTEIFAVYKSALDETQTYRQEILPDLERFYSMSQQAFQHGEINFLEISAARVAYIESSVAYLEALERLADSIVKIEGALLENSLESGE